VMTATLPSNRPIGTSESHGPAVYAEHSLSITARLLSIEPAG